MTCDETFYHRYLNGDDAGLEALMKKYGNPLTLYIDGYLHDVHEAEDLMLDVFAYLFTKKPRIRDGGFKAYLYKTARNMALRHKSKRKCLFRLDELTDESDGQLLVEEMMKLLPLVFYLLVFEPEGDKIKAAAITVALAFATFENVCYLIQNGADRFSFIFFRGFGTGAMHVLCGLIVGGGLAYAWQRTWLKIAGTWGLLGAAITLHAVYNLLIAYGGAAQYVAYALPVLLVAAGRLSTFRLSRMK